MFPVHCDGALGSKGREDYVPRFLSSSSEQERNERLSSFRSIYYSRANYSYTHTHRGDVGWL